MKRLAFVLTVCVLTAVPFCKNANANPLVAVYGGYLIAATAVATYGTYKLYRRYQR